MKRPMYYKLDGHRAVPCDVLEWSQMFEDFDGRRVADEDVDGYRVSTIFIGMDHSFTMQGPPVLFESMIFSPEGESEAMERYSTWEEAEEGHKRMAARLREELESAADQAHVALAVLARRLRAAS